MELKEVNEIYHQKLSPFYEARGKDRIRFTEKAEHYFTELLKLLITLSTAMIAFLGVAKDNIYENIETGMIISSFVGFVIVILFSIIALTLLAYNYMSYTNEAVREESSIYSKWVSKKYEQVKKEMEEKEKEFAKRTKGDWQKSTIFFGIGSFVVFVLSTCFLVILLFV